MKSAVLALVCLFASVAVATPPPAPTITVAATDIKQLQFDITPVTRANWYELWFRANPRAQWVQFSRTPAQRPRIRANTAVHLLDWQQARYFVKACNPSGCTASNEVGVNGQQLEAIGYFKPATRQPNQYYGFNFAVSGDGTAMVVVAAESFGGLPGAAIHVYRKTTSTSGWRLEARLFPNPNNEGAYSVAGDPLSISYDGKLIAFGNWIENNQTGAVYLFRRRFDGWHQTQRITGGNPTDQFGINVKLDMDANTLVIGHNQPGGVRRAGTLDVYRDPFDSSDDLVYAGTIPTPEFEDPQYAYCSAFALSDVGRIARSCYSGTAYSWFTQVLEQTSYTPLVYSETARLAVGTGGDVGLDSLGNRMLVQAFGPEFRNQVLMYRREADSWVLEATLEPFPSKQNHMAMSGDGTFVVIGSTDDDLAGRGPLFAPYQLGEQTGTVALYERRANGWALRRFIKGGSANYLRSFGWEVDIDYWGHVLAVGSPYDASKTTGIDGDREDASSPGRGAVWLY